MLVRSTSSPRWVSGWSTSRLCIGLPTTVTFTCFVAEVREETADQPGASDGGRPKSSLAALLLQLLRPRDQPDLDTRRARRVVFVSNRGVAFTATGRLVARAGGSRRRRRLSWRYEGNQLAGATGLFPPTARRIVYSSYLGRKLAAALADARQRRRAVFR